MIITDEYAIAYAQVLEILRYIPLKDYEKIPSKKIQALKKYAKKEYVFAYTPNLSLDEQNVSEKAKIIIALLFRDYWANTIQKEMIQKKENYDNNQLEIEKRMYYNPGDIF